MQPESEEQATQPADRVYETPSAAEADARLTLRDHASTPERRSQALATLGRSAYYDNRLADAIGYLEQALPLASGPASAADIVLILAPALSKVGRSTDALHVLQLDIDALSEEQRGKRQNQLGIIFAETGQLPEALEAFTRAREIHRTAGDSAGEGRTLVNMAAAASEIGQLAQAEAWYADAWRLVKNTGQEFSRAIIEGNLGYVASRRGDFSAALEWYQRGRASFSELGDVDLLVAVLETDHATTLLDIGLNGAAYEAAEYARASSVAGSNRMLEVQALLLLGEAQLRLRQFAAARRSLGDASEVATDLGLRPFQLRSEYLLQRLRSLDGGLETDYAQALELAAGLSAAGWNREALRTLVVAARAAVDADDRISAGLLLAAGSKTPLELVDILDAAHANALRALLDSNDAKFSDALLAGEQEIERQRRLVGSAELETRLGYRMHDLRELAMGRPIDSDDPHGVLETRDRISSARARRISAAHAANDLRAQLRDVRVGLQEAQLGGSQTGDLRERSAELERRILAAADIGPPTAIEPLSDLLARSDPIAVDIFAHRGRLRVVITGTELRLLDLGPVEAAARAVRSQRTGLRRLAAGDEGALGLVASASSRLATILIEPLELPPNQSIAIVSDPSLAGISWASLDALRDREFLLARSVRAAMEAPARIDVASVGLVGGGGLDAADTEIDSIARTWSAVPATIDRHATLEHALHTLRTADLVHIAAHGTFRADNPFLSALHFTDGDMRLLDLEQHERLPRVVSLASCDSGAATDIGSQLVGTADAFISLGVDAVFASGLIIDDAAAARIARDLHESLADGATPATSMLRARLLAIDRGTAQDRSAAAAFALHGGASGFQPLNLFRI